MQVCKPQLFAAFNRLHMRKISMNRKGVHDKDFAIFLSKNNSILDIF